MSEDSRLAFDPEAVVCSERVAINAPAEKVWEVLVDFERYHQWNPFCVEASGKLAVGEPLTMKLKNYLVPGEYFDNVETICEIDAPHCIAWSAPWIDAWPYPARHLGQAWRIEFSYRNIHEYYARSKGRVREAAFRTRPFDNERNIREYFYKKIRFSTPTLSALWALAGLICLS